MEATELRSFSADELKSRIKQWQEELFRSRFKAQTAEARDTSVFKKLRKDIARALTVLNEKAHGIELTATAPQDQGVEAAPADKPVAKKASAKKKTVKKAAKSGAKKVAKTKKAKGAKKK